MIIIKPIKPERSARHLRIFGLVDVPLFKLEIELLVVAFERGDKRIPIPLFARLLFDEFDHIFDFVDGVFLHVLALVSQRNVVHVRRQFEISVLEGCCHDRTVARHIAGDHALAEFGIIVFDANTRFRAGKRTYVGRHAEALDCVEVWRHDKLVNHA